MRSEVTKDDIVFIESKNNGSRPFRVYTKELECYDFVRRHGHYVCSWCSSNISPYICEISEEWKAQKKMQVWFKEDFRPRNDTVKNNHILTDEEIIGMGYVILKEAKCLDSIVQAINCGC
jgi:hypothetical protein